MTYLIALPALLIGFLAGALTARALIAGTGIGGINAGAPPQSRAAAALGIYLLDHAESEKYLLARTLHDELGGLLVATKMDIVWLRRKLDAVDSDVRVHWERAMQSLDQGLACKARLIEALRPTLLDNLGLVPALQWLIEESLAATGMRCEQVFPEEPLMIRGAQGISLFRLVQEALSNVVRHSHALNVSVEMRAESQAMVLAIRDDGVGIAAARLQSPDSHGLAMMRLRVTALHGELNIGPVTADGRGTSVRARVPWSSIQA